MIDNLIILAYLAGVLLLGLWSGRGIKNLREYSVVNRSYTTFFIFATLSASFIGGGFSLGNAEKVFVFGIISIAALWGFSLKEILVAKIIAPRMDNFSDAISAGDIMEKAYGTKSKIVTGFFSIIVCAGIVGAQVGAMGYIFNVFTGISQIWGIVIGCGIVIAYSTIGGMKAVVATDVVQFVILGIGLPLVLIFGVKYIGGVQALKLAVPSGHFSFFSQQISFWGFLSLFLTFLLGETLVPPYVQRLLIGKNAKHTARGTLLSGLFSIPFFAVTGLIGLVSLALDKNLNPNLAMPYVIKTVLPLGLKGLVVAGMISIVMSSADSFLNSAAISFMNDLVIPLKGSGLSEKKKLYIAKAATLFTGILAVVFAVKIKSILDILIFAYNFWAPIIMVPLAAAILGIRTAPRNFFIAAISGMVGVLGWNYVLKNPNGINGLVVGVICNFVVFIFLLKMNRKNTGACKPETL